MAMQKRNFEVRDDEGAIVPSPTIEVFEAGTTNHADLFSDDAGSPTPLANPFTGGTNGRFGFYTPDGLVDIQVSGDGITTYLLEAELFDYTLSLSVLGSAIQSINGLTEVNQIIEIDDAGTDASIESSGDTHTLHLPTASGAVRGLLHPMHFTLFLQSIKTINGLGGQAIGLITGTTGSDFNIDQSGANLIINIPTASASKRGLLAAADFAAFSAKQAAFAGTTLQYIRGDGTLATLNTAVVPESGNLYLTTARVRSALASPTAPLTYNSSTGVFAIPVATAGADGYLSAANFTVFNNKLGSVAPSITKDSDTLKVDGTRYVRTSTTTVDTTIAETTLSTVTLGGAPSTERTYRLRMGGDVRVGTGGTDTVRYRAYLGGVVVWDSGALDLTEATALPYQFDADITVRTAGGSGVVQAIGTLRIMDSVVATSQIIKSTNTTSVVLTGTPILKTTVQFSVSDATNQINERSAVVSTLG